MWVYGIKERFRMSQSCGMSVERRVFIPIFKASNGLKAMRANS
jgi:hypothetical protein